MNKQFSTFIALMGEEKAQEGRENSKRLKRKMGKFRVLQKKENHQT